MKQCPRNKTQIVLLLWLSFLAGSPARVHAQEKPTLDKIVAVVDDQVILDSELSQLAFDYALQMGVDPSKDPGRFTQIKRDLLNSVVDQKVLFSQAELDSVLVTDEQVDGVLEDEIQRMVQRAGSQEKLEEYLGTKIRQFKKEYRDVVKERLMVDGLRREKVSGIQITRRQIEEFYKTHRDSLPQLPEAVKLRHIQLKVEAGGSAEAAARKRIEEIAERLKAGEDFAKLAKSLSEDPGSADRGGALGLISRGDFVPEFEEVAFSLEEGDVSDVFKSRFGFHIVRLNKRQGEKIDCSHILVLLKASSDDERLVRERLEGIRESILAGRLTFEEAAREHSVDQTTREDGGNLGWLPVDQIQIKEFRRVVSQMDVGEISHPIKSDFGYHIVLLEDRRKSRKMSLSEDWERIENWALEAKRQQEFQKWVAEIKKGFYIEIKGTD